MGDTTDTAETAIRASGYSFPFPPVSCLYCMSWGPEKRISNPGSTLVSMGANGGNGVLCSVLN